MKLEELEQKPFFTTEDAKKLGVSPRMLSYYVKKGEIERIKRGLYVSSKYEGSLEQFQWEDMAIAASNIKGGVICLISALCYYEITDEFMREFWIAVENDNSKAKFPMTRIVRMRNMELGVTEITLAGMKVKIFDIERTIVDSFRYLDFETSMKALKRYLSGEKGKPNIKKISQYAKELRATKAIEHIRALLI